MLGCQPSVLTQRSMHHQKSSSDSPFQANTATPGTRQVFTNDVRKSSSTTPTELPFPARERQKSRAAPDSAVTSQWERRPFAGNTYQPNTTLHHRVAKHQRRRLLLQLIEHLRPVSISDPERCQMFTPTPVKNTHHSCASGFVRVAHRRLNCFLRWSLLTGLWQRSSHFILGGVNVTGGPAALGPESRQSLDQNLKADGEGGIQQLTAGEQSKEQPSAERSRYGEKSYSSLGRDVSAAHDLGAG